MQARSDPATGRHPGPHRALCRGPAEAGRAGHSTFSARCDQRRRRRGAPWSRAALGDHDVRGARIVAIDTYTTPFVGLVRVTADDGAAGWGQTAPYNADITAQVLHRQVVPYALGADSD